MSFALRRNGSGKQLMLWLKFWTVALVVKVVELIVPIRLAYWVAKYAVIMFVASRMTVNVVSAILGSHAGWLAN